MLLSETLGAWLHKLIASRNCVILGGHGFGLGVISRRWKNAACERLPCFGVA